MSVEVSAFGRVGLFGEHLDWAGHFCIADGIESKAVAMASRRDDMILSVTSSHVELDEVAKK